MTETNGADQGTVTAEDVRQAVRLAVAALREGIAANWDAPAGSLEWSCWDTVEPLSDDLFTYAAQLGPEKPPLTTGVPFTYTRRQPGGPENAIFTDPESGPTGLLQVLDVGGALLAAMVDTTPPSARAWHPFGVSDPEGFAAMGVVETLVHMHDVAEGLGLPWVPPSGLCARVLKRLFRDVAMDAEPWPALLWATGRTELPGRPRRSSWRWDSTLPHDSAPSPTGPPPHDPAPAAP